MSHFALFFPGQQHGDCRKVLRVWGHSCVLGTQPVEHNGPGERVVLIPRIFMASLQRRDAVSPGCAVPRLCCMGRAACLGTQHLEHPGPIGTVMLIPGVFMDMLR